MENENKQNEQSFGTRLAKTAALNGAASAGIIAGMAFGVVAVSHVAGFIGSRKKTPSETTEES